MKTQGRTCNKELSFIYEGQGKYDGYYCEVHGQISVLKYRTRQKLAEEKGLI